MKSFKKLAALFLTLVMVSGALTGMLVFAAEAPAETVGAGDIVILHTNDTHSRVDGFAGVAGAKAYYEGLGASVILLDAGDTLHGMPIANLTEGANIVDIMNAVGYDAMAPGNHDFNFKSARLIELAALMDFPVLSCNYIDEATGEAVFDSYIVIEKGDVKIGVVGISTPETATKASPLNTVGYNFSPDNLVEVVQEQIDAIKADCDYLVALGHLGIDSESAPWRSVDVIAATTGIDLFIDGHSHSDIGAIATAGFSTVKDKADNDVILTSSGNYIENIGMVTIKDGVITAGYVEEEIEPDAEVAAMIAKLDEELAPLLAQVVGKTTVDLVTARAPGNRTMQTNLGGLCTDAFRYVSGAEVALTNGGGIRDTAGAFIPAGDITYGMMNQVYPFGNVVVTIEILGADILAALEHGTAAAPAASGGFPQVSGMSYTLDATKTENRITNVMVGDEPLDLTRTYTLATNDFTQIGGDGYDMLAKYSVIAYYGALDEALVKYISEVFGGSVGEEYAEADDSIVIILPEPEPEPAEPSVPAGAYVVVKGDSLWKISQKFYGTGRLWIGIYDTNMEVVGANPGVLFPGTVLFID